jgi:hypothetical protein
LFLWEPEVLALNGDLRMKRLDDRTRAKLDVVLEDVCRTMPNGGDHAFRKRIAEKLIVAARKGNTTLTGLNKVAREAAAVQPERKSA